MDFRKYTCEDRGVPRPPTGKTPNRNLRVADDVWLPALANAVADDTSLTEVITADLRRYNSRKPRHRFTFSEWPEALPWLEASYPGWRDLAAAITDLSAGFADEEYAGVAVWLAMTRHPADRTQQQRVIAGFLLGRANTVSRGGWPDRYKNSAALLAAITAELEEHLPRRSADA
jgi:hypothetical protein